MLHTALLVLEDGTVFEGTGFGYFNEAVEYAVGEVVFNTAMTGYQEILTDPSYADQLITLTYPQMGNVGTNPEDQESNRIYAKGLIVRQLPYQYSNYRATQSLSDFLIKQRILGIAEIDTRSLTKHIREHGALRGCIVQSALITPELKAFALEKAKSWPGLKGKDLAKVVSTKMPYQWPALLHPSQYRVVAYDFGIKKSILNCLQAMRCDVTVVPAETPAQVVLALNPDGIFLSNGPGDPEPCTYAIEAIQHFLAKQIPLFGICLGHQLLALACGAKTLKMKVGHHGANHPVRCLKTNRVLITSQNHGFAVEEGSLPNHLAITHRSLFDNTIQGIAHRYHGAFGFQGHPEAGPGPNEAKALFRHFIQLMQSSLNEKQRTRDSLVLS